MPRAARARPSRAVKGKAVASENSQAITPESSPVSKDRKVQNTATSALSGPSLSESSTLPLLLDFTAQKKTRHELNIANKVAEAAHLSRPSGTRQSTLSCNSVNQYLRYERHWVAWCSRRNYPDICVIPERALRYMEENIAEHPDPEKGVEPLRVRADKGKGEGNEVRMVPPSPQTLDMYIKCLVHLFNQQCADPAYPSMTAQSYPSPREYLAAIKSDYEKRLLRVKAPNAIDGESTASLGQGYTSDLLRQLLRVAWVRSSVVEQGKRASRKRNSLRDRFDLCWLHFLMCRGEITRRARLPDLFSHEVKDPSGGGQFTLGVVLLMSQGKTLKSGRQDYGLVVRNKDVEICPVEALSLHLLEYWTPRLQASLTDNSWLEFHLLTGNGAADEFTHGGQFAAHKEIMDESNIKDAKNVIRQGRLSGAMRTQTYIAFVEALAQHGNWAPNRPSSHYLSRVDAGIALHTAGFNPPNERLCLLRNKVIPPVELQRLVFPFIEDQFLGDEDWKAWIENIMLDRNVFHGRETLRPQAKKASLRQRRQQSTSTTGDESHASGEEDDIDESDSSDHDDHRSCDEESDDGDDGDEQEHIIAKRRHLILLAHLRKVVLQDAAVRMSLGNQDENCRYHQHRIFDHAAFQTQLFMDFRAQLHAVIHTSTNPVTNDFVATTRGIHSQLQSLESRIIDLSRVVEAVLENNRSARESHDRAVQRLVATAEENLNAGLEDIRRQIQILREGKKRLQYRRPESSVGRDRIASGYHYHERVFGATSSTTACLGGRHLGAGPGHRCRSDHGFRSGRACWVHNICFNIIPTKRFARASTFPRWV